MTMADLHSIKQLADTTIEALRLKRQILVSRTRRLAIHHSHIKQQQATQEDVANALIPVFKDQAIEITSRVLKEKSVSGLVEKYDPTQPRDDHGRFGSGSSGKQTDTPEFKAWFGSSEVVDENGKPLVVYHGAPLHISIDGSQVLGDFSAFDRNAAARFTGRKQDFGMDKTGIWFTDTPGESGAEMYSGKTGVIYPVYLSIKHPWKATFDEFLKKGQELSSWNKDNKDRKRRKLRPLPEGSWDVVPLRNWMKSNGYDGINFSGVIDRAGQKVWLALEPTQIKSATGNRGTFDSNNPDITKSAKQKPLLNIKQATQQIVDRMLPILAVRMAEAAHNQLQQLGAKKTENEYKARTKAASTATRWLEDNHADLADLLDEGNLWIDGSLPYRIVTELPPTLKRRIVQDLRESFSQDYWQNIAETTLGDANRILEQGLKEGMSIRDMAAQLKEQLGGDDYARARAYNIARTESGGALNGARKMVADDLGEFLPPDVSKYIRSQWLSVLGTTTRPDHAHLDGVPADKDGMWMLAGYRIPFPGHYSLPPEQRCNCQCSTIQVFGLGEQDAQQYIQEYYDQSK